MKIWANTLVRNEDKYLWFSVMSVIKHVDKVLIWDDGSIDDSVKIAKQLQKIFPAKIIFKELKKGSTPNSYPKLRQQMLEQSNCDWVILVDADEVWWDNTIARVVEAINTQGKELDSIVNGYQNIIGDIFHYQDENAGMYQIDDKKGHLTIRAMNKKIQGLRFDKPHGQLCIIDKDGVKLQERDSKKRIHIGLGYLHFTNVLRSSSLNAGKETPKRSFKYKYELGIEFAKDFFYPESFFREKPSFVESPWVCRSEEYVIRSAVQTPIKKIKRKISKPKRGY